MMAPSELAELKPANSTGKNGRNASIAEGRWAKLAARAITDRSLTATYVRVLGALAIHADENAIAWPSQERIASLIGITRPTVCRAIRRLRDLGYLHRYRKRTPRGHYRNVYQLLYPAYAALRTDCASPEM